MKGTKYLSELVDVGMMRKDKLNIIQSPTGSGKTYFALTHIPSLAINAIHNVVYLIDTINGKEQILQNYNATSEYWQWAQEIDAGGMWFSEDNRVVILTYAKFGVLIDRYTDFHKKFDYIICDELHSAIAFQGYSPKPNCHSVALSGLRSAVANDRTIVIALSATPEKIKGVFNSCYELPINQEELIQYETHNVLPYTDISFLLSSLDPDEIGLCYAKHITKMLEIEACAKENGLSPICIWSTRNAEHPMTAEQLEARESILHNFTIPDRYNLLIINSSSETSIKIKSRVDYVIVQSQDNDIRIQVRGRVNSDLQTLYLLDGNTAEITVPEEFLGVKLFSEDKRRLCEAVNLRNANGRPYRFPSVKTRLLERGYAIIDGRQDNRRFVIITQTEE